MGWCEPDKSEAMARLHKATSIVYGAAFLYGNCAACDHLLGFMQSTLPSQSNPSRAQTLEVSKLVTSVAQGKNSQSISPAQDLLTRPQLQQSPSDKILVLYVLIEAGRRAGFPRLVDELLPEAIELADRSGLHEDRFVFHSLAVERQLDKNPDLPLQTLVKEHDACWRMLDGFTPTPTTSGGGVASRAARYWINEWFKRMRSEPGRKQVTPLLEKDVARLLQLAGAGLATCPAWERACIKNGCASSWPSVSPNQTPANCRKSSAACSWRARLSS
ncbi:hypothetical protein IV102_06515 [bacterium]|nr:hypothetical protein [bacterium]